jgi:hypothetical protein
VLKHVPLPQRARDERSDRTNEGLAQVRFCPAGANATYVELASTAIVRSQPASSPCGSRSARRSAVMCRTATVLSCLLALSRLRLRERSGRGFPSSLPETSAADVTAKQPLR